MSFRALLTPDWVSSPPSLSALEDTPEEEIPSHWGWGNGLSLAISRIFLNLIILPQRHLSPGVGSLASSNEGENHVDVTGIALRNHGIRGCVGEPEHAVHGDRSTDRVGVLWNDARLIVRDLEGCLKILSKKKM